MSRRIPAHRGQHQRCLLHQQLAVQAVDRTESEPQSVLADSLLDEYMPLRRGARQVHMPGVFSLSHAIDHIGLGGCKRHIDPRQHRIQRFTRLKLAPSQPRGVIALGPMLLAQ